jgi:hypothetical protein
VSQLLTCVVRRRGRRWLVKLGDKVGVVCDHTVIEEARAIRAALESFRLRVELHRLVQRWQAEDFFAHRAKDYEHLVLYGHGNEQRIKLQVIETKKENRELGDWVEYLLKPATIPDQLLGFRGALVSTACCSGQEAFGAAFLKAGCEAYLGPTDYVDQSSSTLYVIALFYFLQYEECLPSPEKYTIAEAAEAARLVDRRAKLGYEQGEGHKMTGPVC